MQTRIIRDGVKNILVQVTGEGGGEQYEILHPRTLAECAQFKLDLIQFAVEVGVKLRLGWSKDGAFLPLEGRGRLDYTDFDSLSPSSQGQGLWVEATGEGIFHLVLDLTKQGRSI